jgi:2-(1,2-epoxy-1,2-dihydrophenyl)acetyl-CoA isomerase
MPQPTKHYPSEPIEGLVVTPAAGVLSLRLDRADRRNALTDDIVLGLIDIIDAASSDEAVRVISLSGSGDHFCSGFDLSLRGDDGEKPRVGSTQRQMRWHINRLVSVMVEAQTPIVTAVKGWAIGLGMDIALASDFVVAADDARFLAPFVPSGFTPDSGASWLLPRLVGVARAKDMILLGRRVSGTDAASWGMIHSSVPADEVDQAAAALVTQLASAATVAVGLSKMLVHKSINNELARHLEDEGLALELSSRSEDFHESSRARRDKRDPDFTGR